MNEIYLKYIGAGSYLPDVPARDLTKDEAEYHGIGRLLDSHLYERILEEQKPNTEYQAAEPEEQPKKRGKS